MFTSEKLPFDAIAMQPAEFLACHAPALEANEVRHTIILGLLANLGTQQPSDFASAQSVLQPLLRQDRFFAGMRVHAFPAPDRLT
jgi:hypothetical protein